MLLFVSGVKKLGGKETAGVVIRGRIAVLPSKFVPHLWKRELFFFLRNFLSGVSFNFNSETKTEQENHINYPPTLNIHPGILDYDLDKLEIGMFTIENYQSHPTIKAPLSN